MVKKLLLIILVFCPLCLFAERINFVCDFEYTLKNFAPTRNVIWNGIEVDWIDNQCDQKIAEELKRHNTSNLDYVWEDEFCLKNDKIEIWVNIDEDRFGLKRSDIWQVYTTNRSNKNRECVFLNENASLCEYNSAAVLLDDNELTLISQVRYQPEYCPLDVELLEAFDMFDYDENKSFFDACYNLGEVNMNGNAITITIDRNTLSYTQKVQVRSISVKNGELITNERRSPKFTYNKAGDSLDVIEDKGTCKINNRKF